MSHEIPKNIEDSEPLWRHVHPTHYTFDNNTQCWRVSSAAFKDIEMSVDRGNYLSERDALKNKPEHGLVELSAKQFRDYDLEVVSDSKSENRAHALVKGNRSKQITKDMAKKATPRVLGKTSTGEWIKGGKQLFLSEI